MSDPSAAIPATVRIDKLVAGGDGLGRLDDGCVVFVPGSVPGDSVEIGVEERRRDFARGRLVRVVEPGVDRVEPECRGVALGCGGCDWQHLAFGSQPSVKRGIVAEAFRRTARLGEVEILPGQLLPPGARRTTVRAAAGADGRLGFRRQGSNEVVVLGDCIAAHPAISDALGTLRLDGPGEVAIRVGARTGDIALATDGARIVEGLPAGARLGPSARITEMVSGHSFEVSMDSFFQNSPEAAELLVGTVATSLDDLGVDSGRLVDLYGGVGLFARTLADRFDEVFVVEGDSSACRDAVRNLQDCAATIECCDVNEWSPVEADVVIADPSRSGLGTRGVEAIRGTGANIVVVVSCDPVAAARDARLLVDAGHEVVSVTSLDIFPHTHHVEVVSVYSAPREV